MIILPCIVASSYRTCRLHPTSGSLPSLIIEIGEWKGLAEIPQTSLEESEEILDGEDKKQFLEFIRKMLKWKPEERSSAEELLQDTWLRSETT
jgi:serine/threonine protein kinase